MPRAPPQAVDQGTRVDEVGPLGSVSNELSNDLHRRRSDGRANALEGDGEREFWDAPPHPAVPPTRRSVTILDTRPIGVRGHLFGRCGPPSMVSGDRGSAIDGDGGHDCWRWEGDGAVGCDEAGEFAFGAADQ